MEKYTTYQELAKNQNYIVNPSQRSDRWFIDKLEEHYLLIKLRQNTPLKNMIYMRTIGFATFLRVSEPRHKDALLRLQKV
jgi:hypothetical protein